MTIYERIRQCRLNKGMTQSELAEIMGYTDRSTIAKIETGKVDLFISKVSEFAKVFNVSPMYLMGWTVDSLCTSTLKTSVAASVLLRSIQSLAALKSCVTNSAINAASMICGTTMLQHYMRSESRTSISRSQEAGSRTRYSNECIAIRCPILREQTPRKPRNISRKTYHNCTKNAPEYSINASTTVLSHGFDSPGSHFFNALARMP